MCMINAQPPHLLDGRPPVWVAFVRGHDDGVGADVVFVVELHLDFADAAGDHVDGGEAVSDRDDAAPVFEVAVADVDGNVLGNKNQVSVNRACDEMGESWTYGRCCS